MVQWKSLAPRRYRVSVLCTINLRKTVEIAFAKTASSGAFPLDCSRDGLNLLAMALTRSPLDRRRFGNLQAFAGSPAGELSAVAFAFAVGLVALTTELPGAGPGPTAVSLLVFAGTAAIAVRALHIHRLRAVFPYRHLGLCNVITLGRLALASALIAPVSAGVGPSWVILALATLALSLDGLDGWFARRRRHASAFGARFDMEVDSLLALVLAISASVGVGLGPAAVLLGLPRYLFAAGAWVLPWMRQDLPPRFSRKVVFVVQLSVLIALQAPILPTGLAMILMAVAAVALVWSFARDVVWLWRHRR